MKIILLGSMGRCGSMLLFDIIINYLKLKGFSLQVLLDNGETSTYTKRWGSKNSFYENIKKDVDFNIIKLHKGNSNIENDSDFIFTCFRYMREIIASTKKWKKNFQLGSLENNVRDQLNYYNYWIEKANFSFKFEDYVYGGRCDYDKYNNTISDVLGLEKVDTDELKKNVNGGKITSKKLGVNEYNDVLSKEQIMKIDELCKDYNIKNNY